MKPYLFQHFLDTTVENYPRKEFIKQKTNSYTFEEIWGQSNALASALKELGLQRSDRVGIWVDKSAEQVVSLLGTLYADGIFTILSPVLHDQQALHILNDCTIKILITQTNKLKQIQEIMKDTSVEHIILTDQEQEKTVYLKTLLEAHKGKSVSARNITSDTSNIIYTSGSTGRPKGIVLAHQTLMDGAKIISEYLKITESDRLAGVLPFNFDYGLNQLTTTVLQGASIVLHNFFLPNDLLSLLEQEKITGLAGIPPIWNAIFNTKLTSEKKFDFSRLRYLTNSGGKVPVPVVQKIRDFFKPAQLYLMYGLTEAFRSTYLDPQELDKRPNSMGKAIPNTEIFVINEKGEECQPHEKGELIHRGACIAKGYWNDPEKTKQVYRPNPLLKDNQHLETVVYSGDLVYKDEEGFLFFVSRRDEMIKTQGYRVSPTEIEEILLRLKDIQDAVVFGVENEAGEQKIRALVHTEAALQEIDVINHCKKEAPPYMIPAEIHFYTSFPKTASGKIDRAKLKKESLTNKEG